VRIALVSPYDFAHPGGVNSHISHLATEFRRVGHEATILAPVARDQRVPEGVVPISRSITTVPSGGSNARVSLSLRASGRIKEMLETERYDVVHLHNPLTPMVSASFLYHRDAAPQSVMVATMHEYRSDKNPLFTLGDPVIHRLMERLDGRITVSEAAREFNNTYFPGEYAIIPNGIDVERFGGEQVAPFCRYRGNGPIVLFVGRLEYRKGFRYLLRAWPWVREVVPGARLLVVGAYTRRRKRPYVMYARERRIYGVRFVGAASDGELPRYYRTADVFCAPSTGFESFGIVLLEAMAAGVPVVASDIPGYRSVLQHGVQGQLVAPRDPPALAKAIIGLLSDAEQRSRLGQAGRLKVAGYDWSQIARRVLDFYAQVRRRVGSGRR
jgi:phosphatidylinositol alpha-mannosyltransferase